MWKNMESDYSTEEDDLLEDHDSIDIENMLSEDLGAKAGMTAGAGIGLSTAATAMAHGDYTGAYLAIAICTASGGYLGHEAEALLEDYRSDG